MSHIQGLYRLVQAGIDEYTWGVLSACASSAPRAKGQEAEGTAELWPCLSLSGSLKSGSATVPWALALSGSTPVEGR
jgi:hypothetical protein